MTKGNSYKRKYFIGDWLTVPETQCIIMLGSRAARTALVVAERELHPDPKAKGVTGETGAHPRDTLPTSTARRPHLLILSHIFLAGLSIQIYESVGAFLIQTTLWYCRYPSFFPKVGPVITTPP